MEAKEGDQGVREEIRSLLSNERLILRETSRSLMPFGGLAVFISYLRKIDPSSVLNGHMPMRWRSPNQIDPTSTPAGPGSGTTWPHGEHALRS
jgi:hypothetical protein